MTTTALLPYYGDPSPGVTPYSWYGNRPKYLQLVLDSLRTLADDVVVGVHNSDTTLPSLSCLDGCTVQPFDGEPRYIAANLMNWGQANLSSDFVYVTEADQVLHYDPAVLASVSGIEYLVPHKLERLGPDGGGADRGTNVEFEGNTYCLPAGGPANGDVHAAVGCPYNFGGAYFATTDLFRSVRFTFEPSCPIEHATGFNMAATGCPMKTGNWSRFFVEHLSGYEYQRKLDGYMEDYVA